jgi:D-lactate dehydrogenase
MKVVGFEIEGWEQKPFEKLKDEHEVVLTESAVTDGLESRFRDADIISTFIYSELNEKTLAQFENLKFISTRSTGVNHIDADYCREHRISVGNAPEYGQNTVAEHAFALIHAVSRHIPEAVARTRSGSFLQEGLQGFDLKGKVLGVIGTGEIGKNVIRIANGYEMEVLAFDVKQDDDAAKRLGFHYTDMDDLLAKADIVSLHVPGMEKTRNMIGEEQFARMKHGAVLINTARGLVVNVKAMLKALGEGKLAAVGLDVLPEEPAIREEAELLRSGLSGKKNLDKLLADKMLADQPNVIITPHIGFNTHEAVDRLLTSSVENIIAFVEGNPKNLVIEPE